MSLKGRVPFLLLLLLFVQFSSGNADTTTTTTMPAQFVWLGEAVNVADQQAVRIDIQTINALYHARVTQVVACSAPDKPFLSSSSDKDAEGGCNSPGYKTSRTVIYSSEHQDSVRENPVANKFRVRQTARSLYIRKRLLDVHSPVVHLEVWIDLQDERTHPVSPISSSSSVSEWVLTSRYIATERMLPVGVVTPEMAKADDTNGPLVTAVLSIPVNAEDNGDPIVAATSNNDEAEWEKVSFHCTWYQCSLILFGGLTLVTVLGLAAVAKMRKRSKRLIQLHQKGLYAGRGNYAARKAEEEGSRIRDWISSAVDMGLFSRSRVTGRMSSGDSMV